MFLITHTVVILIHGSSYLRGPGQKKMEIQASDREFMAFCLPIAQWDSCANSSLHIRSLIRSLKTETDQCISKSEKYQEIRQCELANTSCAAKINCVLH